ncbi:oligosaccharyltransferase subunit Ost4 [Schizosaccharomyces japonicus yFS275]|uniref:Oligosaccharyltransferase subunit Ost4 n=1 Tax=Schizosaccharomyces japonicus (strain yFS275 / FY16936) TaxID=402676 RepID=B6K875_SCHJY|nr:oligosaccharyltransferase subunit Ost4 [Schizosaccharomyces japonicus yFS275]EEB09729.1 oligosaccharyltransferase subunit Ost4 [Schizosaccharomyces japonicus yFS275]
MITDDQLYQFVTTLGVLMFALIVLYSYLGRQRS